MKYKYTMRMKVVFEGDYCESVLVSVIAKSATEAINIAETLVQEGFTLKIDEYISIEVV